MIKAGASLYSQHLGYRGRQISVSLRPAWLQTELQDNQGYTEKTYLKNKQRNKNSRKEMTVEHKVFVLTDQ